MLSIAVHFDDLCRQHNLSYVICGGSLLGAVRHEGFIPWDDDFDVLMPRRDFNKFISIWEDSETLSTIKVGDDGYYKVGTPLKVFNKFTRVSEINELENGMPEFNEYGIFLDVFPADFYPDTIFWKIINRYFGKLIVTKEMSRFPMRKKSLIQRFIYKSTFLLPKSLIYKLKEKLILSLCNNDFEPSELKVGYGLETPFNNLWLNIDCVFPAQKKFKINGNFFYGPNKPNEYLEARYGDFTVLPPINMRYQHIVDVKYVGKKNEE